MSLIPFSYADHEVRVLDIDGEPWFVASDIAAVLGVRASAGVTRMADEEDKGFHAVETPGGKQNVVVLNESGMYTALMRSNHVAAKPFRRWITSEVLPSIRKRGIYATASTVEAMLADPDTAIRLLSELRDERARSTQLQLQAAADAPKVIFADAVAVSQSHILVGDLAKILRGNGIAVGGTRLFRWLRDNGFLIRREGSDYNSPTQRAMELGLFRIKETAVTHSDGHVTISKTPKVTGKGQTYFVERFLTGAFSLDGEIAA